MTRRAVSSFLMCLALGLTTTTPVGAAFSSARSLLLKPSKLPAHFRYLSSSVQDSVIRWDGNIRQIVAIDEQNGWLEAAEESVLDAHGHPGGLSVQLFQTHSGAVQDFGMFFTNSHPETIYVPGQHWLGGTSIKGFGDRATLYRIQDDFSRCPGQVTVGLSFVDLNGIFSIDVCVRGAGEAVARELALRLLNQAKQAAKG